MLEKPSFCKVNLLLNILGKRPDGFHELETVMQPLKLHDELSFARAGTGSAVELTCDDPTLPVDGRNLVVRAANLFLTEARVPDGVRISLRKRIPMAAGLGGGSGNAATTLLGLNELFDRPLAQDQLQLLAASLGSDVPFFLQDGPALATGRGEVITPLKPFPVFHGARLLLVHPGFGISTPWAYAQLAQHPEALQGKPGRAQRLLALLQENDLGAAGREFYNSLEAPALRKYPLLRVFQEFFHAQGAAGSLMSGSGSSTFAVFESPERAARALDAFRVKFGQSIWAASLPV